MTARGQRTNKYREAINSGVLALICLVHSSFLFLFLSDAYATKEHRLFKVGKYAPFITNSPFISL